MLAMGSFWGPEDYFRKIKGVIQTRVGYSGGYSPEPTYHDLDGHSETIEITFDENLLSFEEILEHFWKEHNPTIQHNNQYKSIIFYANEAQKQIAEKSFDIQKQKLKKKILTEIKPFQTFHLAEAYHQKYLAKMRGDLR